MKHTIELITVAKDTLHHCSSMVVVPSFGRIVAAYLGPECEDEQCVFVQAIDNPKLFLKLPPKTGNPLLWRDNLSGKVYLLYSLFEDDDGKGGKPLNPVQRWMYCSLWLAELNTATFKLVNKHKVDDGFGLLARCAPYTSSGRTFIPLYREKDPRCEIWEIRNGSLYRVSVFGDMTSKKNHGYPLSKLGNGIAIQPTLINHDNALIAFCRNVCVDGERAWMFRSEDNGLTWSDPTIAQLPNHNNSLVAIPWQNDYMIVLNNNKQRSEIFLGNRHSSYRLGVELIGTRQTYSYPNYCIDKDYLYVIHSNRGILALHRFDSDFVNYAMINSNQR